MQTMDLVDVDHSLSTVSRNRPFILEKPSVVVLSATVPSVGDL